MTFILKIGTSVRTLEITADRGLLSGIVVGAIFAASFTNVRRFERLELASTSTPPPARNFRKKFRIGPEKYGYDDEPEVARGNERIPAEIISATFSRQTVPDRTTTARRIPNEILIYACPSGGATFGSNSTGTNVGGVLFAFAGYYYYYSARSSRDHYYSRLNGLSEFVGEGRETRPDNGAPRLVREIFRSIATVSKNE